MKNKTSLKVLVVALGLVCSIPVIAEVAGSLVMHSNHPSDVSGHSGQEATLGFGADAFITSITWSEKNDHPCYFKIEGYKYKSGKWEAVSKDWAKNCEYKSSSAKNVRFYQPGTANSAALGVKALQVCSNEKKGSDYEKVKGLRIWAAKVKPDGAVTNDNSMEDEWRTNCKNWEQKVSCGDGEVATALNLKYYDWESGGAVRGIGLRCEKVKRVK